MSINLIFWDVQLILTSLVPTYYIFKNNNTLLYKNFETKNQQLVETNQQFVGTNIRWLIISNIMLVSYLMLFYVSEVSNLLILWNISTLVMFSFRTFFDKTVISNLIMFTIIWLLGNILLTTTNLLHIYLILELLAYANLFFMLNQLNTPGNYKLVPVKFISMFNLFYLNFFSSLLIFSFIFYSVNISGLPTGINSGYIFVNNQFYTVPLILIGILGFLIKIGSGPWAPINATSYAGFSLNALYLYIWVFSGAILPIIITLFQYINMPGNMYLVYSVILLVIYSFFSAIRSLTALTLSFNKFLAISSAIFSTYIIILIFVK